MRASSFGEGISINVTSRPTWKPWKTPREVSPSSLTWGFFTWVCHSKSMFRRKDQVRSVAKHRWCEPKFLNESSRMRNIVLPYDSYKYARFHQQIQHLEKTWTPTTVSYQKGSWVRPFLCSNMLHPGWIDIIRDGFPCRLLIHETSDM